MPEFMPPPSLDLPDEAALRAALDDTDSWMMARPHPFSWNVRSQWLIDLIGEIAANEYPYNATVHREARKRLGFPALSERDNAQEGTPLSRLIYNAQNFRRSDELRKAGYEPFTDEVLTRAFRGGFQLELQGSTLLGATARCLLNVREIGGKVYAMQPKKRKYAVAVSGQPVRLVAPQKKPVRSSVPSADMLAKAD